MPSPGYARLKGSSLKFWNFKPSGHTTGVDTAKFSKGLVNRATQPTTVQTSQCARGTEEQLAWLGYKQELFRDWDFWASFSLSCANIGLVPGSIWGLYSAISFGGPVIMLWGYFLSMIFMCCLNAVLAEMSSAYPVTGAMFTCTSSGGPVGDQCHLLILFHHFCFQGLSSLPKPTRNCVTGLDCLAGSWDSCFACLMCSYRCKSLLSLVSTPLEHFRP